MKTKLLITGSLILCLFSLLNETYAAGKIIQIASGLCLDMSSAAAGDNNRGKAVNVWPCHQVDNQQWQLQNDNTIRTKDDKWCLDQTNTPAGFNRGGRAVNAWPCHGKTNQQWKVLKDGTIRTKDGKWCLDQSGAAAGFENKGKAANLWRCHGGSNQKWNIKAGKIIDGSNVKYVEFTGEKSGSFNQTSDGSWIRRLGYGENRKYKEIQRDQWAVYLRGHGTALQIDLRRKKLTGMDTNTYTVSRFSDIAKTEDPIALFPETYTVPIKLLSAVEADYFIAAKAALRWIQHLNDPANVPQSEDNIPKHADPENCTLLDKIGTGDPNNRDIRSTMHTDLRLDKSGTITCRMQETADDISYFIASDDSKVIIAFLGSQGSQDKDNPSPNWRMNYDGRPIIDPRTKAIKHNGWQRALGAIFPDITNELLSQGAVGKKFIITGHSLGGVLSIYLARELMEAGLLRPDQEHSLVTFGAAHVDAVTDGWLDTKLIFSIYDMMQKSAAGETVDFLKVLNSVENLRAGYKRFSVSFNALAGTYNLRTTTFEIKDKDEAKNDEVPDLWEKSVNKTVGETLQNYINKADTEINKVTNPVAALINSIGLPDNIVETLVTTFYSSGLPASGKKHLSAFPLGVACHLKYRQYNGIPASQKTNAHFYGRYDHEIRNPGVSDADRKCQ